MVDDFRQQRIEALKAMLEANGEDAFALYGLALEHKATGELEAARPLLEKLVIVDPSQLYGFYQLGEILMNLDEGSEAKTVLEEGLRRAVEAGESKAANEIQALLDDIWE